MYIRSITILTLLFGISVSADYYAGDTSNTEEQRNGTQNDRTPSSENESLNPDVTKTINGIDEVGKRVNRETPPVYGAVPKNAPEVRLDEDTNNLTPEDVASLWLGEGSEVQSSNAPPSGTQ